MLGTALYYPYIDIPQTGWLKSAMLFWDEIQTIVPTSLEEPYTLPDTKICSEEGYLKPLHCDLYEDVLSELGQRILALMNVPKWVWDVRAAHNGPISNARVHADELGRRLEGTADNFEIHPEKMIPALRQYFEGYGKDDWLLVNRGFAEIYMSALAALLASKVNVSPLTSEASSCGINLRCLGDHITSDGPNAARGALVSVVMEGLRINPETPIQKILKFRRERRDQLAELSGQFDKLKSSIESSEERAEIETKAQRVFENQIRPALCKLKTELGHVMS